MASNDLTQQIIDQAARARENRLIGLVKVSGMRPMLPVSAFDYEKYEKALGRANEREAEAVVLSMIEDKRGYCVLYGRVLVDGKKYGVVQISGPEGEESKEYACSCGQPKQGRLCLHTAAFMEAVELQGEGFLGGFAHDEFCAYNRLDPSDTEVGFPESQEVYDALLVAGGISYEHYQSM